MASHAADLMKPGSTRYSKGWRVRGAARNAAKSSKLMAKCSCLALGKRPLRRMPDGERPPFRNERAGAGYRSFGPATSTKLQVFLELVAARIPRRIKSTALLARLGLTQQSATTARPDEMARITCFSGLLRIPFAATAEWRPKCVAFPPVRLEAGREP